MTAYAALVTLINLMVDVQNRPHLTTSLDKIQIESLAEKVHFLLNFIETYNSRKEAKDLGSQIAFAAQEAEDVIESHIVDRILSGSAKAGDAKSRLHKVMQEMDSMKEKIVEIEEKAAVKNESVHAASSIPLNYRKITMVGFDDELTKLVDILTRDQSTLQIISIVGLCGMGKTTLTKNAFENPYIVNHFDICAWATISQNYSVRKICYQLLSCDGKSSETDIEMSKLRLYQKLFGRRYLIILDDVWDFNVLDEIRSFLPDNGNGSRIVITTRIGNAYYPFHMNCLNMENSWKLFCEKVFGGDDCPPELKSIGNLIVEQCRGLPLLIVVIGGYLSKTSRTEEYWEYVRTNMNSILDSGEDRRYEKILSLSYNHLPAYLKPCFLYTGIFPEDEEICVSNLIRLWVAEGFLKPDKTKSLEEVAESYLEDLVDRNLILVHKRGHTGKIVTCKIHDIIRDLCLDVAKKENFLCILRLQGDPRPFNRERRVAFHGAYDFHHSKSHFEDLKSSAPLVRSIICDAGAYNLPPTSDFKLLKILTGIRGFKDDLRCLPLLRRRPQGRHQDVNLRYLHHGLHGSDSSGSILKLPSSISRLWNLQTLILGGNFHAPPEIWKMLQLRHLVCNQIRLPDPRPSKHKQEGIVMQNLHTLSKVEDFRLSEEVCKRIPNVKNLWISYSNGIGCLSELKSLTKLESLTCEFSEEPILSDFTRFLRFPSSLQELCLIKCCLRWEEMTVMGSLPCLRVLKLGYSVKGNEWNPIEGEFESLKYLEIWSCDDLIKWNAEYSHFPVLQKLTLRGLTKLTEIPLDIGNIPTLEHIRLDECSVSAAISAVRMLIEQESFGNEDLQLEVYLRNEEDGRRFREMVQEEGLNSNNLRLITM